MAQNETYNIREYLAYLGSSLLEDKKSVFVGTGLPIIAAMLAQKTHAPDLLIVFEAGGIGPLIPELPVSVGESRTYYRGIIASSMHDIITANFNVYKQEHDEELFTTMSKPELEFKNKKYSVVIPKESKDIIR